MAKKAGRPRGVQSRPSRLPVDHRPVVACCRDYPDKLSASWAAIRFKDHGAQSVQMVQLPKGRVRLRGMIRVYRFVEFCEEEREREQANRP